MTHFDHHTHHYLLAGRNRHSIGPASLGLLHRDPHMCLQWESGLPAGSSVDVVDAVVVCSPDNQLRTAPAAVAGYCSR